MGGWRGVDYDLPGLDDDGDDGDESDDNNDTGNDDLSQLRRAFRKNLTLSTAVPDSEVPGRDAE